MNSQIGLFDAPPMRRKFGFPSSYERTSLRAISPEFCATVMAVFERHPGVWSSKFDRELWAVFELEKIGTHFALTMRTIDPLLESRNEYFGSKAIGPDYSGFSSAYRLARTGEGNADDIEYTCTKPSAVQKQRRMEL